MIKPAGTAAIKKVSHLTVAKQTCGSTNFLCPLFPLYQKI